MSKRRLLRVLGALTLAWVVTATLVSVLGTTWPVTDRSVGTPGGNVAASVASPAPSPLVATCRPPPDFFPGISEFKKPSALLELSGAPTWGAGSRMICSADPVSQFDAAQRRVLLAPGLSPTSCRLDAHVPGASTPDVDGLKLDFSRLEASLDRDYVLSVRCEGHAKYSPWFWVSPKPSVVKRARSQLLSAGPPSSRVMPPNVLLFIIDSQSRADVLVRMPKTVALLDELSRTPGLSGVEYLSTHVVGFATRENTWPLFFGGPAGASNRSEALWERYKRAGYATFFSSSGNFEEIWDGPLGADHDFYPPSWIFGEEGCIIYDPDRSCAGERQAYDVTLQALRMFLDGYREEGVPGLAVIHFCESHGYLEQIAPMVAAMDVSLASFIQDMAKTGELRRTWLHVGSDHGRQGHWYNRVADPDLQVRLDLWSHAHFFMYHLFPAHLADLAPRGITRLRQNADTRLVNHYDVYQTTVALLDLPWFSPAGMDSSEGDVACQDGSAAGPPRGCNLLSTVIPSDRECHPSYSEHCVCGTTRQITNGTEAEASLIRLALGDALAQINVESGSGAGMCCLITETRLLSGSTVELADGSVVIRLLFATEPGDAEFVLAAVAARAIHGDMANAKIRRLVRSSQYGNFKYCNCEQGPSVDEACGDPKVRASFCMCKNAFKNGSCQGLMSPEIQTEALRMEASSERLS